MGSEKCLKKKGRSNSLLWLVQVQVVEREKNGRSSVGIIAEVPWQIRQVGRRVGLVVKENARFGSLG
jgi:hypothetical protein